MASDFIAGMLGGATGVLVGHPFDTVKVRLQTQTAGPKAKYKGVFQCFTCILKEERNYLRSALIQEPLGGHLKIVYDPVFYVRKHSQFTTFKADSIRKMTTTIKLMLLNRVTPISLEWGTSENLIASYGQFVGLYKGISSPVASFAFINAIVFGVYGNTLKEVMRKRDDVTGYFIAGSTAGLAQAFISSPMELAKVRLQLQGQGVRPLHIFFGTERQFRFSGPFDCLLKTYRSFGVCGVFRGLSATILRDCPGFGVYFASYEYLYSKMSRFPGLASLFAGGLAGVISWLTLYPVDVVKSRFQADEHVKYRNLRDCAVQSYRQEGWRVYTIGIVPTVIRAFPINAVTFFIVGWVLRLQREYTQVGYTNSVVVHERKFTADSSLSDRCDNF